MSDHELTQIIERKCSEYRLFREQSAENPEPPDHCGSSVAAFLDSVEVPIQLSERDKRKLLVSLISCEIQLARQNGASLDLGQLQKQFPDVEKDILQGLIELPELPTEPFKVLLPSRFEKQASIGIGGLGEVWRVFDRHMKRTVAIKMLKSKWRLHVAANQRLQREAELTGLLQHPGVPPVYDQGFLNDGSRFFAMKLVDGRTFADILKEGESEPQFLINVFEQVVQTIAYSHSREIIHRDIKPSNIMVGQFGEVQLMDWGMAKRLSDLGQNLKPSTDPDASPVETLVSANDSSVASYGISTRIGDVLGTPAYMAPEQANGNPLSASKACDVFSLGVLLFEILAGKRLYEGESAQEVLVQAAKGIPQPVEVLLDGKDVEQELKDVCSVCLAFEAKERPSASEVARMLSGYQLNLKQRLQQAEIDRSSALVQSSEQKKRTRITMFLSGIVALVSLAGASAFAWQWNEAVVAQNLAIQSAATAVQESETRQEISDFLIYDFLARASPDVEPDRDLKVRTVLEQAAEKIDSRFGDKPETEYEIRLQIGRSFYALGEYEKARLHFERAHEICEKIFGADHENTWEVFHDLAAMEEESGNNEKAELMFRKLVERSEKAQGDDSELGTAPALARLKSELVSVLTSTGKFSEAESLMRDVVDNLGPSEMSPENVDTILSRFATTLIEVGKFKEAKGYAEEVADSIRERIESVEPADRDSLFMEDISNYSTVMGTLAFVHEHNREYDQSEKIWLALVAGCEKYYGDNHVTTLVNKDNLAICISNQGRPEEAHRILLGVVEGFESQLGSLHEKTIGAKNTLAGTAMLLGDFQGARKQYLELRESLESLHEFPHDDLVVNYNNSAYAYLKLGMIPEALDAYGKAAEGSRQLLGDEHPQTIFAVASLANVHRSAGNFDESEKLYMESLKHSKAHFASDHPDTLKTKNDLAFLYLKMKRYEDAEKIHREILPHYKKQLGEGASKVVLISNMLGQELRFQKKYREAAKYLAYSFAHRASRADSRAKNLFYSIVNCEEKVEAFESILTRIEDFQKVLDLDKDDWLWLSLESRRGKTLFQLDEFEKAETVLLSAFEKQENASPKGVSESAKNASLTTTAKRLLKLYEATEDQSNIEKFEKIIGDLAPPETPKKD